MNFPETLDRAAERSLRADADHHVGCDDAARSISPVPVLALSAPKGKSQEQWEKAQHRLQVVTAYRAQCGAAPTESIASAITRLSREGVIVSRTVAVRALNDAGIAESRATLDRIENIYTRDGFAGLFDNREKAGRPRKIQLFAKEVAALKAARIVTNRSELDGSTPEAVRLAARRGQLRPEIAAEFFERERTGRMVPEALHNDLVAGAAVTKQFRNPTEAGLDYLNAPGALMWVTDARTGEERFIQAGDILEADDATVNFHVCVPWEIGGDPCSEKYGVRVARFQWLVAIDRATRFVPGWSYTMRPRSSYRAEDVLSLFHGIFRQHGIWQRLCLERGVWEANKVSAMLKHLHVERLTAWSPHQKPFIEGLFNLMWTKLSDLSGQVGRFQGEEEEACRVAESCRRGATDPRHHFPMLADALEAFRRATAERNAQTVKSNQWGSWVPEERWLAQQQEARAKHRLRALPTEAAWMFSPEMREWTVQGNTVGGAIQIMDGLSVRFDFAADWLTNFVGSKVRVHFDPAAPRAEATIVLAQPVREHRAGEVLGTAVQVNKTARYARRALGWGDDADLGITMRREAATALRREVRTIKAGGETGLTRTEVRDGEGNSAFIERHSGNDTATPSSEVAPRELPADRRLRLAPTRRGEDPFRIAKPEEAEAQGGHLSRLMAAQRRAAQAVPA